MHITKLLLMHMFLMQSDNHTLPRRAPNLKSDNFRNGRSTHILNVYYIISLLFSTMLSHFTAPAGLFSSTMVKLIENERMNEHM